jgi:hypothetical protein
MSTANRKLMIGLGLTSLPLLSSAAWGAEWLIEPQFEAGVQSNSNIALSPDASGESSVESYSGDVGLLAEVATPRSNTLIKPSLRYESFLDRSDLNRLEGFLEFNSAVRGLRNNFDIAGDFSRRNQLTAELADAEFNQINPDLPSTPGNGDVRAGETRDLYTLRPEYSYRLTERVKLGASALYQITNYSGDDNSGSVDYDYSMGTLFSTVGVGPRTDLTAGAFVGRYEATSIDSESNSVGATLKLAQRWSDRLQFGISASYQEIDITQRQRLDGQPFGTRAAAREDCPFRVLTFLCPPDRGPNPMPRPDPGPNPPGRPAPMMPPPAPEPGPMTPPTPVTPTAPVPTPTMPPAPQPPKADPVPPPPAPDPVGGAPSLQSRAIEETNSAYGLELNAAYGSPVSRWALSLGRQVTPTGSGGLSNLDQVRVQYDRAFSERLSLTTAVRAFRNRSVSEITANNNDDRDYARANVSLNFMITATWYVRAGYEYTWQDREADSRSANNNLVSLAFGYRGLQR